MTNSPPDYDEWLESEINEEKRIMSLDKYKCVVYKDGAYKFVEHSWEFENDPDWLVTIDLENRK